MFIGLNESVRLRTAWLCGLQHVLSMFVGIITPPLVVGGALGLSIADTSFLVSMALFTSGLTTFIQVRRFGPLGSGLLSVQGTSFTFVPVAIQTGGIGGLPLILGMAMATAPLQMLLSRFLEIARRCFPPVVTGSVVMLIGISLIRVGMTDLAGGVGAADFGHPRYLLMGGFVMFIIIVLHRFGRGFAATIAIAAGIVAGYVVAAFLGWVDFAPVREAHWWVRPQPLHFGLSFDALLLLPWLIAYFITTLESMGDITATSEVSREPVTGPLYFQRLKGGVLADGFNSIVAAVFNALPNTTFSQNNGVIRLTGIASRRVGFAVAGWLVVLGLFPKFAALVSVMPKAVLGGATIILFATVAVAGLRIVFRDGLTPRSELILTVTLALGLGVTLVPDAGAGLNVYTGNQPIVLILQDLAKSIAQSAIAVGALTATVLNLVLPVTKDEPAHQH
jgi:xanthine permease XanP